MDVRQYLSFNNISSSDQQEIASIFLILLQLDKLDIYYSHCVICNLRTKFSV